MRRKLWLVLGIAACGTDGSTASLKAGPPAALNILAGNGQVAPVATTLPTAIRIRVTDDKALAVPDQLVSFVVTAGGGSVFLGTSLTDSVGEASDVWTLGTIAGPQTLEARAIVNGMPVVVATVTATAEPGPLAVARFLVDTIQVEEGQPTGLAVEAFDAYDNPVVPVPDAVALDPSLGPVIGNLWTPSGFGRARFVVDEDTLVAFVRMKAAAYRAAYQVGGWYTAVGTLEHDPSGSPLNCQNLDATAPQSYAIYVANGFEAWNSDSSATFGWHRLEHFLCQDLRFGTFTGQLAYYWPDQVGGAFVRHLIPVSLTSTVGPVLTFSTGGYGPDTVEISR